MTTEALHLARHVFDTEIEALAHVRDSLDARFQAAVDLLLRTLANGGKIVVTGVGKNLHIAEKISATLASTGSTSVVLNPSQAIHGDLGVRASEHASTHRTSISQVPSQRPGIDVGDSNNAVAFQFVIERPLRAPVAGDPTRIANNKPGYPDAA